MDRTIIDVEFGVGVPLVVMLHGFGGGGGDLAPFARSLRVPGRFVVAEGPVDMAARGYSGRAWWPIDVEARDAAVAKGEARDLSSYVPDGLDDARQWLGELLDEITNDAPESPLVLAGFSQGGMLACDLALRTDRPIAALAMFSSARIADGIWRPRYQTRRAMPMFMSHGRSDRDLSFAAAETFKDDLVREGYDVTWVPFDGGHEIPLVVLRELKKFLRERASPSPRS